MGHHLNLDALLHILRYDGAAVAFQVYQPEEIDKMLVDLVECVTVGQGLRCALELQGFKSQLPSFDAFVLELKRENDRMHHEYGYALEQL